MPRDIINEIRSEIGANKVMVYMKGTPSFPMCGFSAATVELLREHGVPFAHVNILEDQEKREAIKAFSNWPTIPQVYVDGKFIGGCDIVRELHTTGELGQILKHAFGADAPNVASAKS